VDHIPQAVKGKVLEILNNKNERNNVEQLLDEMDLRHVQVRIQSLPQLLLKLLTCMIAYSAALSNDQCTPYCTVASPLLYAHTLLMLSAAVLLLCTYCHYYHYC
jgi:translation initiation factor RLI1